MHAMRIARLFCRKPREVDHWGEHLSENEIRDAASAAQKHGLGGMAYTIFRDADQLEALDPNTITELADEAWNNLETIESRKAELPFLNAAFFKAGIELILLKQYSFDGTFPSQECVRQTDFNLLIWAEDLPAATAIFENIGYDRIPRPSPNDYRYVRKNATPVDLQFITKSKGKDLFDRSLVLPGIDMRVLDPTDTFRCLLIHTANYHNFVPFSKVAACWNFLIWHLDEMDPNRLVADMRAQHMLALARLAMSYICDLLDHRLAIMNALGTPSWLRQIGFRSMLPKPADYFQPGIMERLRRGTRAGVHNIFYADRIDAMRRLQSSRPTDL
jgi:hypothetical protein